MVDCNVPANFTGADGAEYAFVRAVDDDNDVIAAYKLTEEIFSESGPKDDTLQDRRTLLKNKPETQWALYYEREAEFRHGVGDEQPELEASGTKMTAELESDMIALLAQEFARSPDKDVDDPELAFPSLSEYYNRLYKLSDIEVDINYNSANANERSMRNYIRMVRQQLASASQPSNRSLHG